MEEMDDNDNNNNNLKKREIASKRLAKRLALELKRHESGSSDDSNANQKLDKNSKFIYIIQEVLRLLVEENY